jgi:anaerobic selenocysteine-containing dehydrogenase
MNATKPHAYKQDIHSIRPTCVCGQGMLAHVHSTNVVKITTKPNKKLTQQG